MVDRWLAFCVLQFVSGILGFFWSFYTRTPIFMFVGGFFFSLGVFAITRWGYDRWKSKQKPRRRK
ncbi:MAG: hypothetical protein ACREBI_09920 [Nitrosotalea sp.]